MLRDAAVAETKLQGRFGIKTTIFGSNEEEGEVKEARILNRISRVTSDGWEYEADQRHANLIIQETGASGMSNLTHPGEEKKVLGEEGEPKELVGAEATRFRAVAAEQITCRRRRTDPTSSMQ